LRFTTKHDVFVVVFVFCVSAVKATNASLNDTGFDSGRGDVLAIVLGCVQLLLEEWQR